MLIRKLVPVALAVVLLAAPLMVRGQAAEDAGEKNAKQARTALQAMVKALGGDAWLHMKSQMRQGHVAAFYQGKPSGGTTDFWEFHSWPDQDRFEYTKHRDVVQLYLGRAGWEVTYKGKAPLPKEQVDDYLRRRDHSIETVVKTWLNDPKTILVYEGQHLAERHLAEQVTLISAQNEAVTILMDMQTHLPLRRTFEWRDPVYKDKNLDAEEYDAYHLMDGFPTPLTIARFKNNEMVSQRFIDRASYNQDFGPNFWNVDTAAQHIAK